MHHANSNPTNCGVNIEVIYFCFDFKVSLMSRICVKHGLISVLISALTVPHMPYTFLCMVLFVNVIVLISKYLFCTVRQLNSTIFIVSVSLF